MKPPRQVYPMIKEAQFTTNGRPYHSLFYTGRANFYQACYEIEDEAAQQRIGVIKSAPETRIQFTLSSRWLS